MRLQDWLAKEGLTYGQFGAAIGRSAEAVRRYANGDRIPERTPMSAIVRETGGEVTPNDFYGFHASTATAPAAAPSPGKTVAESPSIEEAA